MAISFVGSATGTNSIASMPAHQAGDLLLFFAYRDGNITAPSLPSGYTNKGTSSSGSAADASARIGYKIATSSSETSGTWTNATSLICHVYRGVDQTTPLGSDLDGSTYQVELNSTVRYPTLTLDVSNGSSWIAAFVGHDATNTNIQTAPTGMTNRTNVVDATDEAAGHDTNGGVSSWTTKSVSVGGTTNEWIAFVFEILAGVSEVTLTAGNSNQLNQSSSAAITQNHVVAAGNSDQVNSSASGAISQIHVVSVGNPDQINESSSGAVSQTHVLTTGDSDQINESSGSAITQEQTLVAGNSDQINESSGAAISQEHVLAAGNSDQINEVSDGALDTTLTLVAGSADQPNESSGGEISQEHVLVAGGTDQSNESSSESITQEQTLVAGDVEQVNEASGDSITHIHALTAGDADQVNESASAAITQEHVLSAGNADQVNESSAGSIDQEHFLTAGDVAQVNEISGGSISFTVTLESVDSEQINQSSDGSIAQTQTLEAGGAYQINEVTAGSVGVINLVAGSVDQINPITGREISLEDIVNLRILYKNDFDSASMAVTSSAAGFPLANTKINKKSSVWRSTSLSSQTISGSWGGAVKTISGLALAFSNLIEGSTVRLKLYQEIADTSPYYDSGIRTVWFAYDPPDGFETIGLISFAFGGGNNFSMFFNETAVKRFEIIVTSPGNPDGYIEVGRIILGKAWTPLYNHDYGAKLDHIDDTEYDEVDSGDPIVYRMTQRRKLVFDISDMTDDDKAGLNQIRRSHGGAIPVFVSLLPGSSHEESKVASQLYGHIRENLSVTHVRARQHASSISVTEI